MKVKEFAGRTRGKGITDVQRDMWGDRQGRSASGSAHGPAGEGGDVLLKILREDPNYHMQNARPGIFLSSNYLNNQLRRGCNGLEMIEVKDLRPSLPLLSLAPAVS